MFLMAGHRALFRQAERGNRTDELLEILMSVGVHGFGGQPEPRTMPGANTLESEAIHRFFEDGCPHGGSGVSRVFMKYLSLDGSAVGPPHRHSGRGLRHLDRAGRELPPSADLNDVVQKWNAEIYSPAVYFVEVGHSEKQ